MPTLEPSVLDQLFHEARTHNVWLDNPVDDELLHTLYDTVKYGRPPPTARRPASSSSRALLPRNNWSRACRPATRRRRGRRPSP